MNLGPIIVDIIVRCGILVQQLKTDKSLPDQNTQYAIQYAWNLTIIPSISHYRNLHVVN